MRTLAREAAGYFGISVIALAVDMGVLALLVHDASLGYLPAACISFCVGLLVSYTLSVSWVFKHRRLSRKPLEFASFAVLGSLGLGVNAMVMSLAVRVGGLHYLIAKGLAAVCTFTCNFIARRQLLFAPRAGTACGSAPDV